MTESRFEFDLVVLTADKNMMFAFKGLLTRHHALGIIPISSLFYIHPESDPGCLLHADDFLRPFINRCAHAIVMFDREGCGKENSTRIELENEVRSSLVSAGWSNRAAAIVIDPELENWVFSDSPEVDAALGWRGMAPTLRAWLQEKHYLEADHQKPLRPKEAMEAALRQRHVPRSSSIYGQLSENVSIQRCTDGAFLDLKKTLQRWFPAREESLPNF